MSLPVKVFLVSQGSNYEIEKTGGFIWAPQNSKNDGAPMFYWENLKTANAGDIIVHYADKTFKAISEVHAQLTENGWQGYSESSMPEELPNHKEAAGWLVKCEYVEFTTPLLVEDFTDIILKFKSDKHSAFDKNGDINIGYLYLLENEIAKAILNKAVENQSDLKKLDYLMEYLNG